MLPLDTQTDLLDVSGQAPQDNSLARNSGRNNLLVVSAGKGHGWTRMGW